MPLPGRGFFPGCAGDLFIRHWRAGERVLLLLIDFSLPGAYFSRARKVAKARQNLRFWNPLKKRGFLSVVQGELAALIPSINGEGYFVDTVAPATGATF